MRPRNRNAWIVLWMILTVMAGGAHATATHSTVRSIDDMLSDVAREVPAFGGMFIDADGRLAIYLTDTRQLDTARSAIAAVFGRDRVDVTTARALPARYTFPELKRWHDRHRLETLALPGVVMTGINKSGNRLRVGVESADVARAVGTVLAGAGVPAEAVEIFETEPFSPYANEKLTDTRRPFLAGQLITDDDNEGCTLGFLAVLQGKAGFLTNSHCTKVQGGIEGTVYHQATLANELRIGLELSDPPYFSGSVCPAGRKCRFSDSAFFGRSGGLSQSTPRPDGAFGRLAWPDSTLLIMSEYEIVAKVLTPIDGEKVQKVGMATGITSGQIWDTCFDINSNTPNVTFFCQEIIQQPANGIALKGDSGSAVFKPVSLPQSPLPTAFLYGLLWGGNNGQFAGFSSLSMIQVDLGPLRVFPGDPGPNSAPEVKIVQPLNFSQVDVGAFSSVDFKADIVDYEGCCQSVTWTSDVDGVIGQGPDIQFSFPSPGLRKITVTVKDNDGGTASDTIKMSAGVSQPTVTIVKPTLLETIFTGVLKVFSGTSLDPNAPYFSMPCSALTWTSSNLSDPFPLTGCNPQVTFATPGIRTITLTGAGAFGFTAVDTVDVSVVNPQPNSGPVVTILNPLDEDPLPPNAAITLVGTVKDSAPGQLQYEWWLHQGQTHTSLGTGTAISGGLITLPWKPGNHVGFSCGGTWVLLELRVLNPGTNIVGKALVDVWISYPLC